jgi:hypothetical protein
MLFGMATCLFTVGCQGENLKRRSWGKKKKYGLITRLASHASGRLSGDQFCVYVANRLVIPSLRHEELSKFSTGDHTLDRLTNADIHSRFDYQFAIVDSSKMAYEWEMKARKGLVFGVKPLLNPA